MDGTQTYLEPIEKPGSILMKLVYYFTKKQLGKVITPIKVLYARLPIAFVQVNNQMNKLDKKISIPQSLIYLIRNQVARINVCEFCMDISAYQILKENLGLEKVEALYEYETSHLFTGAEKAALNYVSELTRNKSLQQETVEELKKHFTEREICEIVFLVSSEHFYNMTNLGLNIHSDSMCDITKRKIKSKTN
jgi:alkylhydroperoxidase family enzyme